MDRGAWWDTVHRIAESQTRLSEHAHTLFVKINKVGKTLAKFIKKKRERAHINRIKNEKGEVTMDTTEIQRITTSDYMPIKWTT